MSERPHAILAGLITMSLVLATLLAAGLVSMGPASIVDLIALVVGAFTDCTYFLSEFRNVPLLSLFLVTLVIASAAAFLRAGLSYWHQRRVLRHLQLTPVDGALAELAHAGGAAALFSTEARRPAAFCFGLLKPSIVVTDGLLRCLTPDELAAAIHHEARHARAREPLRCLAARLATASFFWMPLLADLFERYLLLKELDADVAAQAKTSSRALAGALYKVLEGPIVPGTVGLADRPAARFDRIFDPEAPLPRLWHPRRVAVSAFAAVAVGWAVAYPMPINLGGAMCLRPMLVSASIHGLPGMAAGLLLNVTATGAVVLAVRRFARGRASGIELAIDDPVASWER